MFVHLQVSNLSNLPLDTQNSLNTDKLNAAKTHGANRSISRQFHAFL